MRRIVRCGAAVAALSLALVGCSAGGPDGTEPNDPGTSAEETAMTTPGADSGAGAHQFGSTSDLLVAANGFTFNEFDDFTFAESTLGFAQFGSQEQRPEIEPESCAAFFDDALSSLDGTEAPTVAGLSAKGGMRVDISSHAAGSDAESHESMFSGMVAECPEMRLLHDGEPVSESTIEGFDVEVDGADSAVGIHSTMTQAASSEEGEVSQVVVRSGTLVVTAAATGGADTRERARELAGAVLTYLEQ